MQNHHQGERNKKDLHLIYYITFMIDGDADVFTPFISYIDFSFG